MHCATCGSSEVQSVCVIRGRDLCAQCLLEELPEELEQFRNSDKQESEADPEKELEHFRRVQDAFIAGAVTAHMRGLSRHTQVAVAHAA